MAEEWLVGTRHHTLLPESADQSLAAAIAIAFEGRQAIVEAVVAEALKANEAGVTTCCVLACSSDVDFEFACRLREEYGQVAVCKVSNRPLGRKWQVAVETARTLKPEFLVITGSDDIISRDYITKNLAIMRDQALGRVAYAGPRKWYIAAAGDDGVDVFSVAYTNSHRMTLGAGRIYAAWFLDQVRWEIFDRRLNRRLDDKGHALVVARDELAYVTTVDDGFVLSVKGDWQLLNSIQAIQQASTVICVPAPDAESAAVKSGVAPVWLRIRQILGVEGEVSGPTVGAAPAYPTESGQAGGKPYL